MGSTQSNAAGPELAKGISIDDLPDGRTLLGHVGEDPVLLARRGREFAPALSPVACWTVERRGSIK